MNYTALDKAILLEKALLLNGMIAYGTPAQKKQALATWADLQPEFEEILKDEALQQQEGHHNENPFFD